MSGCPVCGKQCYQESSGEVETAPDGSCVQVTPDEGYCSACGFQYSQHYKHSPEEQAERHRVLIATAETPLDPTILLKMLELDRDRERARAEAAETDAELWRKCGPALVKAAQAGQDFLDAADSHNSRAEGDALSRMATLGAAALALLPREDERDG